MHEESTNSQGVTPFSTNPGLIIHMHWAIQEIVFRVDRWFGLGDDR